MRGLRQEDDKLTQNLIRIFGKKLKSFSKIKIFKYNDFLVQPGQDYCTPEMLKMEGIEAIEAYFVSNQQKVVKFMVKVKEKSHMLQIMDNMQFMGIYSPLFINFLGLVYEPDLDRKEINLEFIQSPIELSLRDYIKRLFQARKKSMRHPT